MSFIMGNDSPNLDNKQKSSFFFVKNIFLHFIHETMLRGVEKNRRKKQKKTKCDEKRNVNRLT